jgi:MoxR-like ATPase
MKILIDYPSPAEESEIVLRHGIDPPEAERALNTGALLRLQEAADAVAVDHGTLQYAVDLVQATRDPARYGLPDLVDYLSYGASPRATLGLVAAGRALAMLRKRSYVVPQDVFDVAPDVLRHRLVLSYESLAQGVGVEHVLARLLSTVPAPHVAGSQPAQPTQPTRAAGDDNEWAAG